MSIDWEKVGQNLKKKLRIKSQFLVDLKNKINILEINLEQAKKDLKMASEQYNNSELKNKKLNEQIVILEENKRNIEKENKNLHNVIIEKEKTISELKETEKQLTLKINSLVLENEEIENESESSKVRNETEIASIISDYAVKIKELETRLKEKDDNIETLKSNFKIHNDNFESLTTEIEKLKKEKIALDFKISEKSSVISKLNEDINESKQKLESQKLYIEESDETNLGHKNSGEYRITCPACSSTGNVIKEIDDKSKIIDHISHIPIYAKKHQCKKCGCEF
jgi:chromosome segregation ATPase